MLSHNHQNNNLWFNRAIFLRSPPAQPVTTTIAPATESAGCAVRCVEPHVKEQYHELLMESLMKEAQENKTNWAVSSVLQYIWGHWAFAQRKQKMLQFNSSNVVWIWPFPCLRVLYSSSFFSSALVSIFLFPRIRITIVCYNVQL